MDKIIWILMAFVAGALLPIQAGMNSKLGKAADSPVGASMLSFVVGLVGLLVFIFATSRSISWAGLRAAPGYVWFGGLIGAFYVTVIILAFPKLGPGLTFGLIVAGQMLFSILLEHFNILVVHPQPISIGRVVGMLLVVAGVIIIKRF